MTQMGNDTLGSQNASAMIKIGIVSVEQNRHCPITSGQSPGDCIVDAQAIGPRIWFSE